MQQQSYQRQHQRQRDPLRFLWVLLIIVAALAAIYFYVIPFLASSSGFDPHAEALQLALKVQDYRKDYRSIGRNLGMGEIVLQAPDGTLRRYPSPIYEGEKASASYDPNANHAERRTHDLFLLPTLKLLQDHGTLDKAQRVSLLILSQVFVCPICRAEMRGWWKAYKSEVSPQNAAKIQQPTVWELTGSYNPDRPGWPQWTVVANEGDVEQVNVPFDQ